MKINYNEGGKWFTLWLDTQGEIRFRVWFGPIVKGFVLFSISFAIYNPRLSKKRAEKFAKEMAELLKTPPTMDKDTARSMLLGKDDV